ncbi:MAG TPA: right-handed parallel beta-helix repeat-containing protein [Steroidobacteraceae bacterium]|nr:right-handed parallel beta-helix repeat-containing protein [Steroidobacteraceae bacterium]
MARRSLIAVVVVVLLAALGVLGRWYEQQHAARESLSSNVAVHVTSGNDRGPGTLREALFIVATAPAAASIVLDVAKVSLESPLPPLVNGRGIHISARAAGTELDAHALGSGAVLDVAAPNATIEGLLIRGCPGAGILLRAARFRLQGTTIQSCDVGVEVAENASDVLLEHNRFSEDRVGVRFASSIADSSVSGNTFHASRDAGLWAVRSEPDTGSVAINVHDNRFQQDHTGIVTGNVSLIIERNELSGAQEAALHLVGPGAVIRNNTIVGGAGMGIIAENTRGTVIEGNEIDGVSAYAILLRNSANALIRANRIQSCAYGMAFVLGNAGSPSTAVDNIVLEPRFNGIDVIGDSPILRHNQVVQPHALALHVEDYQAPDGHTVHAAPFLEGNSFSAAATVARRAPSAEPQ